MKQPIISISGIRGIFGVSLNPENIITYSNAFAHYLNYGRIVIGRDGRFGGDIIEKLVESVLLMSGCEAINLGMVPTPTIALAVEKLKADGGISFTASHNPQEWNGMKFINSKGIFLNAKENRKFLKFADEDGNRYVERDKIKQVEYYPEFIDFHINKVLSIKSINVNKIKRRKFKVVVDCVNASGSFIIPKLLVKLGCKVIKVDCDGSGIFNREPEPAPENLKNTFRAVKKHRADLGIVVDPDADRLVIITEEGKPFGEEYTIVTAINHVLKCVPPRKRIAVVNLSTTRAVNDLVNKYNGKLYRSPVGEVNVINKMIECKAIIGGEGSGGVILPELHYGRDSLVGIALVLSELVEFGGKVSEYKKQLPEYHILKTKLDLNELNPDEILNHFREEYKQYKQNEEDGLRIDFKDSWVNFRKSNTEPIIRIITEVKTMKQTKELQTQVLKEIESINKR